VQDNRFPIPSPLGNVSIAAEAIAQIVGHTAARCYGVVGLAPQTKVARLLGREIAGAVSVSRLNGGIKIDLHVVVEHGLNLAEVAATVRSQVGYEVGRLTGLSVSAVEVHIQNVRQSA
jgi:uncharacterized alkaline shock family protein YloU